MSQNPQTTVRCLPSSAIYCWQAVAKEASSPQQLDGCVLTVRLVPAVCLVENRMRADIRPVLSESATTKGMGCAAVLVFAAALDRQQW